MSEKRKQFIVLTLGILGILFVVIGTSFALFSVNLSGKKNQAINTGCLKVEMTDNGSLSLSDSYPLSDEEGMQIDPYTFTIENVCSIDAYYETTINVMNGSNLDNISKIKLAMDGDTNVEPIKESNLPQTTLVDSVTGVERTYKIDEGFLKVGEEKTFNLREWIDYDVEEMTGTLENKVIINSEAKANGTVVYNTKTSGYYALKKSNILKNVRYKEAADKSGIVEVKEGDNVTYHYRGNPNNYLSYGTYNSTLNTNSEGDTIKWRILSSNSDGSLNLISDEVIGNSSYTNVQTLLNSFYTTHLEDEESYIKTESTFCKEGATNSEYLAKLRTENSNPTSECNGTSITKIGLPIVDDLMYGGSIYNKVSESYLNKSTSYLTNSLESANNVYVLNQNKIDKVSTSTSTGVRAVITLDSDVKLSGLGTESKPFYVTGTSDSVDTKDEKIPEILYARVDERWENENKQIEISARDDNSIGGYFVSTTNEKPDKDAEGWEASESSKYKTIETYDNGTYYVYVKDASGNISEAKEVKIDKVDKVAPTCSIRVVSAPDSSTNKTLSILTEDTDIDLNGYSWDHSDENTSIVKVNESDLYTAHITDLAGNQGTCNIVVVSEASYELHDIVFIVEDEDTHEPIKNAEFELTGKDLYNVTINKKAKSDIRGIVTFAVPEGSYEIKQTKPGDGYTKINTETMNVNITDEGE